MQVTFGGNWTKVNMKHCERFQYAKSYYVVPSGSPDVDGTISAKFHVSVYARSGSGRTHSVSAIIVRKFTQCQNRVADSWASKNCMLGVEHSCSKWYKLICSVDTGC